MEGFLLRSLCTGKVVAVTDGTVFCQFLIQGKIKSRCFIRRWSKIYLPPPTKLSPSQFIIIFSIDSETRGRFAQTIDMEGFWMPWLLPPINPTARLLEMSLTSSLNSMSPMSIMILCGLYSISNFAYVLDFKLFTKKSSQILSLESNSYLLNWFCILQDSLDVFLLLVRSINCFLWKHMDMVDPYLVCCLRR